MDPPRYSAPFFAPGVGGSASRYDLPAQRDPDPCVDDHIVEPETRAEILHGRKLWASPARPAHARQHARLAHLLEAHAAEGYLSAVDMLTRTGPKSDFAPDASVYPAEPDPTNGRRRLEELAFEICSRQALKIPTEKARELIRRGVRRVFCLVVPASERGTAPRKPSRRSTGPRMLEWSRETDGWSPLPENALIEDRCFTRPLPVRALLNAAETTDAVAEALRARGSKVFLEERAAGRAEGKAEGKVEGKAESLLTILEARGIAVTAQQRRRILATTKPALLNRWLRRAVTAASLDEVWE